MKIFFSGFMHFMKFFEILVQVHICLPKGDIVKQPMKKGSFVPKNVPGVGWGGVGGS